MDLDGIYFTPFQIFTIVFFYNVSYKGRKFKPPQPRRASFLSRGYLCHRLSDIIAHSKYPQHTRKAERL